MIPLRIRVDGAGGKEPFVVRLRSAKEELLDVAGPWDLLHRGEEGTSSIYDGRRGALRLSGAAPAELAGDVLLVDPVRSVAHRLIRANSPHNTFLVTERCDQLCVMCSQPPKSHHTDLFPYFMEAAILAPRGMTIGISGGEPLLYKDQLFTLLSRVLAARPDLRFHILTNAQHFGTEDTSAISALPRGKVLWGIPLYASDPASHDEIVAKPGAFERLMQSLAFLARYGAAIELRTVVMTVNAPGLEELATYVARHTPFITTWAIMQLENIGYGRMNWDRLFFDSSRAFGPVGAAIDVAQASGIAAALYNFPLCTVPEAYRRYAHASISDWKRRYLQPCEDCELRDGCGGFFAWYSESNGFAAVGVP